MSNGVIEVGAVLDEDVLDVEDHEHFDWFCWPLKVDEDRELVDGLAAVVVGDVLDDEEDSEPVGGLVAVLPQKYLTLPWFFESSGFSGNGRDLTKFSPDFELQRLPGVFY